MGVSAAYDAHADWYHDFMSPAAGDYLGRVHRTLADLLGPGQGVCLDVCCGTGAHATAVAALGWTAIGVDLSRGQLRHAAARLPVAVADATALPIADGGVDAAVCVLASTDVPEYGKVVAEIARVLRPGGRFAHLGVHPCFVGAFADWADAPRVVVDQRYAERGHTFETWNPRGVRARVGGWQIPLADLLNTVSEAGLRLVRTAEAGPGGVPDLFGFLAVKHVG
ncbi:class I SAM-dependent methyltransferase [Catellatospora sp. KI3]|uniref:class I SAM-dependent methyltransferase n=1 Tax=Catellatospora sp. KI3 TaxID=3041620 RepID=UPI002482AFDA|nr:class I SAM-dependent methyltransferase [Catellatospora sp. KI3]MDI1461529.1 class I SAM-dependent methyltransferase [Catellatospora sp. KI3]